MFRSENLKYFLLCVLVSIGILIAKLKTFNLPFFWDEAWVYGPAIKIMAKNLCFLPECANEYTRGHPLLFHYLGGLWIKLFGMEFYAIRWFPFLIFIALQYSCLYIGTKLINARTGFYFSTVAILQNILFSQANLVFPEILLTLTGLWTFYFYLKEKFILYTLSAFLTCLVKEQGVLMIISILLWDISSTLRLKSLLFIFKKNFIIRICTLLAPISGLVFFVILQKFQKGYWFYPEHLRLVRIELKDIAYQFKIACEYCFHDSGRYYLSLIFLAAFLFKGKIKPIITRILLLLFLLISIKLISGKWELSLIASGIFAFIFCGVLVYRFAFSQQEQKLEINFFGPSLFFILIYILFCSFNFFTDRYLTTIIPFVLLGFVGLIDHWLVSSKIKHLVFLCMTFNSIIFLYSHKGLGDTSPYFYKAVILQEKVTQFAIKNKLGDKKLLASFVMANNLTNPESGFVNKESLFRNVVNIHVKGKPLPDYVLELEFEKDQNVTEFLRTHSTKPIAKITYEDLSGHIYKVNK